MGVRCGIAVFVALAGALVLAAPSGGALVHRPERAPFIIGVWSQPSYSFAKWRARGINTVVGFESLSGTVPYADWREELERQDLFAIRRPHGVLREDARDPRLLAWMQPDGPDAASSYIRPATLQRSYRRWKRAARRLPVFLNLCGACVLNRNHPDRSYRRWIAASDWVSNDFYPITGQGHPSWIDLRRDPSPRIGAILDRLSSLSRGKRQIQIIEASRFGRGAHRAATPAELRGMVWHSIIHGASGIVYFPQQVDGDFDFDAAPPRLVAAMTRVNRAIARLAPVLLSRGERTPAPSPFERATRRYRGRVYTIVLNLSHRSARYRGWRYRPYEVRVTRRAH